MWLTLPPGHQEKPNPTLSQQLRYLPDSLSLVLLHGTAHDGASVESLAKTLAQRPKQDFTWPGQDFIYRPYLPEVQYGTGIVDALPSDKPAYKMLNRDLGAFRVQQIARKLGALHKVLSLAKKEGKSAEGPIGEMFGVPEHLRSALVPLIQESLLSDEAFLSAVDAGDRLIRKEAAKTGAKFIPPILDTQWFKEQAEERHLKVNWNPDKYEGNALNPRFVYSLSEVAELEAHLGRLQTSLEKQLEEALPTLLPKQPQEALQASAKNTAKAWIRALAPNAIGVGHSQGGVVLQYAMLNGLYHASRPDSRMDKSEQVGTMLDVVVPVASPVNGMTGEHKLVDELIRPFLAPFRLMGLGGPVNTFFDAIVSSLSQSLFQAAPEVMKKSRLMRAMEHHRSLMNSSQKATLTVSDPKDLCVEPEAAQLEPHGQEGVFNHVINLPQLPTEHLRKPEYVEQTMQEYEHLLNKLGITQLFLPHHIFNPLVSTAWEGLKQAGFIHFQRMKELTGPHWAPVLLPQKTFGEEVGDNYLNTPAGLKQMAAPVNPDAMRAQAFKNLDAELKADTAQPTLSGSLSALQTFLERHPDVIPVAVDAAKEGTLAKSSAAYQATTLLQDTLNLLEQRMKAQQPLTEDERELVREVLTPLKAITGVPVGEKNLSEQAEALAFRLTPEVVQFGAALSPERQLHATLSQLLRKIA